MTNGDELRVTLQAVTPIFLGGADPNGTAELRPPSIKGVLRFWYRALDPGYRDGEPRAFGDTSGQAPVLLRLGHAVSGNEPWGPFDGYTAGDGTQAINGIKYLGYSLALGNNKRVSLPPSEPPVGPKGAIAPRLMRRVRADELPELIATVCPRLPCAERQTVRRAWVAALWCLVHFGGLGARSRRGLGSIRALRVSGWAEETGALFPAGGDTGDPVQWHAALAKGLKVLRCWYPCRPEADHPVLDERTRILLFTNGYDGWDRALNAVGKLLQVFRQRNPADYKLMQNYLQGGKVPECAPDRIGFGLPLTFRRSKEGTGPQKVTLQIPGTDRWPSPLWIRIARIGKLYYPLCVRLAGPPPAQKVSMWGPSPGGPSTPGGKAPRQLLATWDYPQLALKIIDRFLDEVVRPCCHRELTP